MTTLNITPEAIEAAARIMCKQDEFSPASLGAWENLTPNMRWSYRRDATRVLNAAAPHIAEDNGGAE